MSEKFSMVFESNIFKVKEIVGNSLDFLKRVYPVLSDDEFLETKLIISETLINAVIHGNDGDIKKTVSLQIQACRDYSVVIQVSDEGAGFDYEAVVNGILDREGIMREYGRGVMLIFLLSDNVSYNKKGNTLRIYKKVIHNE